MQQWQVSSHAHCDAGACHIADIRCDQQVYAWSFKAPCQTLDDGLLQCAGTSYRHGVRVLQTNARHHFVQPAIENLIRDIHRWLIDHVHDGESSNRITIEHVHDLGLGAARANNDGAVQEMPIHALMA